MTSDTSVPDRAICVRFHTDIPVEVTPYQLKGSIIRDFPDHPLVPFINGEYRGQLRYPRVQVKVLRQQLCIFGIGAGYDVVRSFHEGLREFTVDDQTYKVENIETPESELAFNQPAVTFLRSQFIPPWVARNHPPLPPNNG